MNIDEATKYLLKFQRTQAKFKELTKEKEQLKESLISIINSVILDSPKIEEVEHNARENNILLHLKFKKLHLIVGVYIEQVGFFNTNERLGIQIFSSLDQKQYLTWNNVNLFSDYQRPIRKNNFSFAYLANKIEETHDEHTTRMERSKELKNDRKQRSEEIEDLNSQITEVRGEINPMIELEVDKTKTLNLKMNNISGESLDKLLKLLREFK